MVISLPIMAFGQFTVHGHLRDSSHAEVLSGATIKLHHWNGEKQSSGEQKKPEVSHSNSEGFYEFRNVKKGTYLLEISFVGYKSKKTLFSISQDTTIDQNLHQQSILSDEVMVRSTRASDRSGTVFSMISAEKIGKENLGKDLPYLLESVPSAVASSDGGVGVGYTALRIRGSDPTSINVTINGIPYNDAESLGTYFVDIPDMASSIQTIQVQRGVGSSTNGAGAFGGSLNIQTETPSKTAFAGIDQSAGSFGTLKSTLKLGTGQLAGGWVLEGRLSRTSTDGYVERAAALLKSFFVSAAHYGKSDLLRINVFSGTEKTYQAWNGVPQDTLPVHRRYNSFTYPNQTDNYTQDHYQVLYSRTLGETLTLNAALHLTHGKGYYEEYESQASLSNYGIIPVSSQTLPSGKLSPGVNSTGAQSSNQHGDTTDLVRRQWLDNYFGGITWSLLKKTNNGNEYALGGAFNDYRGLHFGEIIWTAQALNVPIRYRYYDNTGLKSDFNIYGKASWILGDASLSADLQYRAVRYRFFGLDEFRKDITAQKQLYFFNPKLGFDYALTAADHAYFSAGVASKEPNRDDYVQALPSSNPKPEKLLDLEGGIHHRDSVFSLSAGMYAMFYRDQLVLTGKLNDVGNPVRTNVNASYRLGLEVSSQWNPFSFFKWNANFSLSRNRIKEFDEILYDETGKAINIVHHNTTIAFSPAVTAYSDFDFNLGSKINLDFISHFVGKQFLDNTSDDTRKLNSYFLNDIRISKLFEFHDLKQLRISIALNNIASVKYESNGASYPYVQNSRTINSNYYFPQAGINILCGISLLF